MAIPKTKPKSKPPNWAAEGAVSGRRYHEYDHPEDDHGLAYVRQGAIKRLNELSTINRQGPRRERRTPQPIPRNEPTAQGDQVSKYFPEKRGFGYMADRVGGRIEEPQRRRATTEDWKAAAADPSTLPRLNVSLDRVFEGKYSPEGLKGTKTGTKMAREDSARELMKRKLMGRGRQWVADQARRREAKDMQVNERRLRAILGGEHPDFVPKPGLMLPEFQRQRRIPDLEDLDMPFEMPEKGLRYPTG